MLKAVFVNFYSPITSKCKVLILVLETLKYHSKVWCQQVTLKSPGECVQNPNLRGPHVAGMGPVSLHVFSSTIMSSRAQVLFCGTAVPWDALWKEHSVLEIHNPCDHTEVLKLFGLAQPDISRLSGPSKYFSTECFMEHTLRKGSLEEYCDAPSMKIKQNKTSFAFANFFLIYSYNIFCKLNISFLFPIAHHLLLAYMFSNNIWKLETTLKL